MDQDFRVIHQEVPRTYRTEIPNIVFELLEDGDISSSDLTLYSVYRRIAGENGACWYGTRALAKKCGLSHPTIAKSKKVLSQPFEKLGGKSLIQITPCDRKKEEADTIMIVDIWPENHNFFKKRLTCEKIEHTGVKKEDTRVCKNKTHKKEPLKKEPIKEVIIAKPPPEFRPYKPAPKDMPAGGNNNFFKCLDKCEDLSDRQKRLLMKYPEHLVEQAIRYAYHPTTQITGGPIGRIKLLQHFLQNPDAYAETMENLDKPRQKKKSKKETLIGRFKHGEIYNGYEYSQDDVGVGFWREGLMHPRSVRWDSPNFTREFLEILEKCGIEP